MAININDLIFDITIIKPWGKELIFSPKDAKYTIKMIQINDGCRLSLQSHDEKMETFVLISGQADLVIGNSLNDLEIINMKQGTGYTMKVNTIHRLVGVKDAVIMEGSTPETGNTFRYQDDYKRPDETEEIRNQDNRGWNPSV